MHETLLILPVLTAILGGALLFSPVFRENRPLREGYTMAVTLLTSVLLWALILRRPEDGLLLLHFTGDLNLTLKLDGMGSVFAALIATLWPLATLYAFEYMRHADRQNGFLAFYTMTFGVTAGIALAGNMLTLYMFYEMLTLVTVPLVMHDLSREAVRASRKYLYYSLGGAAFAFIGMVFPIVYGMTLDFRLGGVLLAGHTGSRDMMLLIYMMTFFGFGVKAAIFPFHGWLPAVSVAPTPVTALLHAVAVVKSGAFAVLRLTYYSFGASYLFGTWAQKAVMAGALVTIVYASSRALKETHFKRRLAYSTVSNLSYVLFAATLMIPAGLVAALCHMLCHAVIKIGAFCCAGAVMHQSGRQYIYELDGIAHKMPFVFTCFTVSAVALPGIPPLAGFLSKWHIAGAAIASYQPLARFGVGVLLYSALMTAIYMLTVAVRAWSPQPEGTLADVRDPNWYMKLPLALFAAGVIALGLCGAPVVQLLEKIALGQW